MGPLLAAGIKRKFYGFHCRKKLMIPKSPGVMRRLMLGKLVLPEHVQQVSWMATMATTGTTLFNFGSKK